MPPQRTKRRVLFSFLLHQQTRGAAFGRHAFFPFGPLPASGQSQTVQHRFHWKIALGVSPGTVLPFYGKTVTPYSLLLLKDPAGGFPLTVGSCPTLPYHPSLCGRLNKSGSMMLRAINFFALLCS